MNAAIELRLQELEGRVSDLEVEKNTEAKAANDIHELLLRIGTLLVDLKTAVDDLTLIAKQANQKVDDLRALHLRLEGRCDAIEEKVKHFQNGSVAPPEIPT